MSQPANEETRDFREYLREHLPPEWLDVDDALESYSAATVMIVLSLLLRLAQDTRATLFSDQFFQEFAETVDPVLSGTIPPLSPRQQREILGNYTQITQKSLDIQPDFG